MLAKTDPEQILVTGATGYVGARLVPRLISAGYRVRVMVRDARRLKSRGWMGMVEVTEGDVLKPETLPPVMDGIQLAYYLIHSMNDSNEFHDRDLKAARHFAQAARDAGVEQIIYLGGLGDPDDQLSPHLRSRQLTGEALQKAGVPVTELRAAVIVGSGSVSFEMIRYLTERVPLMVCPQWVYTRIQPIAIRNVLDYLVAVLDRKEAKGRIIEIGGTDVMTYGEMMLGYARARGLRRYLLPVPILTPLLSSYWVHWVTPIPAGIARPLIKGLRNEVIVRDPIARTMFPEIKLLGFHEAVSKALERLEARQVDTAWSDALVSSQGDIEPILFAEKEGMFIERRQKKFTAPPEAAYKVFSSLGGKKGWLYANWAWVVRGALDRVVGGVGLRRGRRDPENVRVGDALDFWRVEDVQPGVSLRLRAEMKVPGRTWLHFEAKSIGDGKTILAQTAYFAPKGLLGLLYWYILYPIHGLIFQGMINEIAARAIVLSLSFDNPLET